MTDFDRQCFMCGSTATSCRCSRAGEDVPDDAIELDAKIRKILGVWAGQAIFSVAARIARDGSPGPVLEAARAILDPDVRAPWTAIRNAVRAAETYGHVPGIACVHCGAAIGPIRAWCAGEIEIVLGCVRCFNPPPSGS